MSNYLSRGSEWRRWDLHVHTKGTMKNDNFNSQDFDSFCIEMFRKAIANNVDAIGITDYFNIGNYEKVKQFVENIDEQSDYNDDEKRKIKNIFILPNVELRMLPVTDSSRLINIHCLFNPEYTPKLDNDFFGSLEHSGYKMNCQGFIDLGKSISNNQNIDDRTAYEIGIENFAIEPGNLQKLLNNKHELRENVLVVVSNSSNDGASGLQGHYVLFENEPGSLDSVRQAIYKLSDAIFSSNENDRKYFLGQKYGNNAQDVTQKCGSLKPCIHGSDAHTEDKLFCPDQNRYCWIKADLTFEGLKQILHEPEDRVKIQESKPDYKESYQIIDSVRFDNEQFMIDEIYVSQNLTTIIGGKSTGKSLLLGSISQTIDSDEFANRLAEIYKPNSNRANICIENFKVIWKDGQSNDTDNEREQDTVNKKIIYIPQSYLNRLVEEKEEKGSIHKIIENVLKQEKGKVFEQLADSERKNQQEIATNIASLFSHIEVRKEQIDELKSIGDRKGIEGEIRKLEDAITVLKKTSGMSEDDIKQYNNFVQEIKELESIVQLELEDQRQLTELKKEGLFYEIDLSSLSETIQNEARTFHEQLTKNTQSQWGKFMNEKLASSTNRIEVTKNKLEETTKKLYPLIEKTKQSDLLKEKIDQIKIQQDKLKNIETSEKSIRKTIDTIKETIRTLVDLNNTFYKLYNDSKEEILSQNVISNGLEFSMTVQHKTQSFQESFINDIFDNRTLPKDLSSYQYTDKNDFYEKFDNLIYDILKYELTLKNKYTKEMALTTLSQNWYKYDYQITQDGDDISQMSPGKRSLVLLKLLVELDNSKCPILLDQPEDDLDNRSIYNDLVKFIKNKKKERQIIIVTHNPNLVVGADAECIIVANQNGTHFSNKEYQFEYVSGSLEKTFLNEKEDKILYKQGIREHVCEILEGGNEAFLKREQKYGMKDKN